MRQGCIVIFFIFLLIEITSGVPQVYDFYKYKEYIKFNPSLIIIPAQMLFKIKNNLLIENEIYEKNNIEYENQNFKILPELFGIIPVSEKFSTAFELSYNQKVSNIFNRGRIFNTYQSNHFISEDYSASFSFAKSFSKEFSAAYQFVYKKYDDENKYIENNQIYNYRYLRSGFSFENNVGIELDSFFVKIGYCNEKIIDFYSSENNLSNLAKRNEFIFHNIKISITKPAFISNRLRFLLNIEFLNNLKTEQSKFTIYNKNFIINILENQERFELYFFRHPKPFLIFYGIQQEYISFKRYNNIDNEWQRNYIIDLKIITGIEMEFLKYFELHLENIIKFERRSFSNKTDISFSLTGGLIANIKKGIELEVRGLPIFSYLSSRETDASKYGIELIVKLGGLQ